MEGRSSSTGVGLEPTPGPPILDAPIVPRFDLEPSEDVAAARSGQGYWSRVRHRFFRDKGAVVGAAVVLALIIMAMFAQRLAPYDPGFEDPNGTTMMGAPLPPSPGHWLGTDANGRDALSRVIFGSQVSLEVGLIGNGVASIIGLIMGSLAGYFRGWVDTVISRIIGIFLAFPVYLMALALVAVLTPSITTVIGIIIFVYWTATARIIRGQVFALRERDFVEAARAVGQSELAILIRHIFPHLFSTLAVYTSLGIATTVLFEAGLSYLGVGVPHGTPSWGGMISDNQDAVTTAPWLVFSPGVAIMLTVISFNLLGDGLREALDPYKE